MKGRGFQHSLHFRITLALLLPLVVTLFGLSYMQYASQRAVLMSNLRVAATDAGEIVEGTLERGLASHNPALVQQIMDDVVMLQGVLGLRVVDGEGQVVFAAGEPQPSLSIPLSDPTCQACHQSDPGNRNQSIVLRNHYGARMYRNVNVLESWQPCPECGESQASSVAVLITDLSMADVDRQLTALARNSALWSIALTLAVVLIVNVMLHEMVIRQLRQFVRAIVRVGEGDLEQRIATHRSDEIGELADSFNRMADGLKEKQRLEEELRKRSAELQAQVQRLAALNTVAATINQSLNLTEILYQALHQVLQLTGLNAGWIVLRGGRGEACQLAASRGLPATLRAGKAQTIGVRCVCHALLERTGAGEASGVMDCPCPDGGRSRAVRVCVPLQAKDRVLGAMGLSGEESGATREVSPETAGMLTTIGQQMGVAIENARLYEELRQKDALRKQLLERAMTVQEEERRRIARELHDETSQALTSLLVRLQILEQSASLPTVLTSLGDLRGEVVRTLDRVHELALELRPRVLDDLGLVAALRRHLRDFEVKFRLGVDFQVLGLNEQRLPSEVETALYRIAQEALLNVVRHAEAKSVSVLLEKRGLSVALVVEDDGKGFDAGQVMGSRPHKENLGLYGMQERASLVDGTVTIESSPGSGTSLFVEIPLEPEASSNRGRE